MMDWMALLTCIINWIILTFEALVETIIQIVNTQPLVALGIVGLFLLFGYFVFSFTANSGWALAHGFFYLVAIIAVATIAYIIWTNFGVGAGISGFLTNFFGG